MDLPEIKHFNIRAYGLLIENNSKILITDEYLFNRKMTKFPGGGMRFGEGPADCIKREALEEFGQEIEVIEHFYTTHFFQRALFYDDHQLISIYYIIKLKETPRFKISAKPFDFAKLENGSQSFRWAEISTLEEDELSFPVDSYVLRLLKTHNQPKF
jgi:8-oxo-dGTP diphosphatase